MTDERGFTLVELLVGMTLMLLVLGAVLTTFEGFERQARQTSDRNEAQDAARTAIDRVARDMRNAISGGSPIAQAVERATGDDLVFKTIGPTPTPTNPTGSRRVRWCLNTATPSNATLVRQVQTSDPLPAAGPADTACPGTGWNLTVVHARNLTNAFNGSRPLFAYRFRGTGTALSDMAAIMPTAYVDTTPGRAPAEVALRSGVLLRNANQPPVAAWSWSRQGTKIIFNASAAADPEGQTLTYDWFFDGATTPNVTGVRAEWGGFAAGSTHSVRLRVTDPSGAWAEDTKSVVQ